MNRLLIAHGTDLLVRGYRSSPPDRLTPAGVPASGLFGVARVLRAGLAFKLPELAIAVVDARACGETWDNALRLQAEALPALLRAHGFVVVASESPAQQVAAYVRAAVAQGGDAVVLASDKRFAQLVGPRVWWYDGYKRVRYTPALVEKRFLVAPEHVADWLALVGDDTALQGVKGIGAKGAAQLIGAVGPLRDALQHPEALPGRAGKALRERLEQAREQLALAHLDRPVPLPMPPSEARFVAPTPDERNAAYAALGFYSLLADEGEVAPCLVLEDAPESFGGLTEAAIFALTEEPSPVRGDWVGLAVVAERGRYFFPTVGPRLARWLEDPDVAKLGHDTKAAAVALALQGVALRGIAGDSVVASHLLDPSGSAPHELDPLARTRLRRSLATPESLLGTGASTRRWSDVGVQRAGGYACQRAEAAGAIWARLTPGLRADHVEEYLALSETLVRMELAGVPCDARELVRAGGDFEAMSAALEAEIFKLAGRRFNLRSPKQLGEVLYVDLKLTIYGRTKTGWSTATPVLERLVHDHAIVGLVIRHRLLDRLRSSWVVALQEAIGPDGRVHATFHPARSFSGRLVCSNPDLGRVPGKTPEMARIRRAFRSRDGWTLLSVDYDQLGLYVLAHLTGDPALIEPLRVRADMHTATASAVLDLPAREIGPEQRQIGKVVNFATFAGQGASALRRQLGVSVQEAKTLIARFDQRYAAVRAFQDEQLVLARERGWVETITGRRWRIQDIDSHDAQMRAYGERLARRAPHEGSVADVTRRALLRADEALRACGSGAVPLLQIHDEVLFEVPTPELMETARVAADAFRAAFELTVPLQASCKAGATWADLLPLRLD